MSWCGLLPNLIACTTWSINAFMTKSATSSPSGLEIHWVSPNIFTVRQFLQSHIPPLILNIRLPTLFCSWHVTIPFQSRKVQTLKDLNIPWSNCSLLLTPGAESHPTSRHNAMSTLLMDDSPRKAELQPYNHLCVKEYSNVIRNRDLVSLQEEKAGLNPHHPLRLLKSRNHSPPPSSPNFPSVSHTPSYPQRSTINTPHHSTCHLHPSIRHRTSNLTSLWAFNRVRHSSTLFHSRAT
jgi:hypothetical protein